MNKEDWKHANKFGDLKDTKYWFKRDINTFKVAIKKAVKISHLLLVISLFLSFVLNYWGNTLSFYTFAITSIAIFPVSFLGYVLFHAMQNKGYSIDEGTYINESQNPNPHLDSPNNPVNLI